MRRLICVNLLGAIVWPHTAMKPLPLRLLARSIHLVPPVWHATLWATAFNCARHVQPSLHKLDELNGTRFAICIADLPLRLCFAISKNGLLALQASEVQVTISGRLIDFIALASGIEDPDTLFFQRRLSVEGETETGLHLKNVLDGLACDPEAILRRVLPKAWAPQAVRQLQAAREAIASRVERLSLAR